MTEIYSYFYSIDTDKNKNINEQLIDFNEIGEFDRLLENLPKINPSQNVVSKILKLI